MYILFITIGIALGIGTAMWKNQRGSYFQESLGVFLSFSLMIGLATGFMFSLIGGAVVDVDRERKGVAYEQIVAIGDGGGVEGRFFLGSGTIKDVQYYFFYQKQGSGFIQSKIRVDQAVVYETDDIEPHIMTYESKIVGKYKNWFIDNCETETDIFIPVGSISRSFNLDLNQ